jgi:hypothetical protein
MIDVVLAASELEGMCPEPLAAACGTPDRGGG